MKPLLSKEEYKELWEKYGSIRAIARHVGYGRTKVRNDMKKYDIDTSEPEPAVRIAKPSEDEIMFKPSKASKKSEPCGYDEGLLKVVGHRVYDEKSAEELFDAVVEYQKAHNGQKSVCKEVEVEYDDDFLVVVFLSDLHIGSESTELELMRYHMKELAKRKNLVMVLCGDYTDNFITFAQNQQLIPPSDQQRLLEYTINTIKDKVVGLVRGNHEERDKKVVDKDLVEMTCKMANIPYMGAEGWIKIKVKEQEYKIHVSHSYRFESSFNLTNAVKRMFEREGEFDIGVVAHKHQGDIEQSEVWGKQRVFIRPGTYMLRNRWAVNESYHGANVCTPCVLLFGKGKHMIPFYNLEDALRILDLLQKEKKQCKN